MKFEKKLNVSADQFFQFIKAVLIREASSHTGKEYTLYQIRKGFSYRYTTKKKGKEIQASYTVTACNPPREFAATISEPYKKIYIQYTITPAGGKSCVVCYEQEQKTLGNNGYDELSAWSRMQMERRLKKQLSQAEASIHKAEKKLLEKREAQARTEKN